jgi:ribonuclease HI
LEESRSGCAIYSGASPEPIHENFEFTGAATAFQAELYAIKIVCEFTIQQAPSPVTILSESQAAIMATANPLITSRTVLRTVNALNALVTHGSSVLLHWVRGHNGVEGNELADHLANKEAALQAAGPEPFLPFSNALIKRIAREDLKFHWTEKWCRLYCHHRQTKDFFPEPHPAVSKCLLKLNRRDLGLLIRHFTGFSNLNYC